MGSKKILGDRQYMWGFPGWLSSKKLLASAGEAGSIEDPLEEAMSTHPSILAGEIPR